MTNYDDGLKQLKAYVDEHRYRAEETEDDFFQSVLDHSLRYVEQGKDLKENYSRLLTVARYTVNTLDKMIPKCKSEGAVEEFRNYQRLVESFDYGTDDVMKSYERLRDIFENLLFASAYFGFCEYLVDAGPIKSTSM